MRKKKRRYGDGNTNNNNENNLNGIKMKSKQQQNNVRSTQGSQNKFARNTVRDVLGHLFIVMIALLMWLIIVRRTFAAINHDKLRLRIHHYNPNPHTFKCMLINEVLIIIV